jgi:hypothetical protein
MGDMPSLFSSAYQKLVDLQKLRQGLPKEELPLNLDLFSYVDCIPVSSQL